MAEKKPLGLPEMPPTDNARGMIEKQRTITEADLLKGGAEYTFIGDKKVLVVSKEQLVELKKMEEDIFDEAKYLKGFGVESFAELLKENAKQYVSISKDKKGSNVDYRDSEMYKKNWEYVRGELQNKIGIESLEGAPRYDIFVLLPDYFDATGEKHAPCCAMEANFEVESPRVLAALYKRYPELESQDTFVLYGDMPPVLVHHKKMYQVHIHGNRYLD